MLETSPPYPPQPDHRPGWFRVACSDAGLGGPGWMRCTSQGNDYRADSAREVESVTITCSRAALAGVGQCERRVRWKSSPRSFDWLSVLIGVVVGVLVATLTITALFI